MNIKQWYLDNYILFGMEVVLFKKTWKTNLIIIPFNSYLSQKWSTEKENESKNFPSKQSHVNTQGI